MPFLPLLPKQILLNNFLSDLPALTIATDTVDPEQVLSPRQWDNKTIRRFMVTFGLVSSLFDILTFIALLVFLKASEAQFQTGWFIESLLTELLIILVIRTRRSVFRSRPSRLLALAIIAVTAIAILVPYTAVGAYFGLTPLPWWWLATLIGISSTYIATSELLKTILFPPLFARRGSHGYTDN
jgi:Mg2+-importing ATPase